MAPTSLTDELVRSLQTSKLQEEIYDSGFDGKGSFGLRIGAGGKRAFFLIYTLNGKRRRITIGPYPQVSLAFARERALSLLRRVRRGFDPAAENIAAQKVPGYFSELVELYMRRHGERNLKSQTVSEYRRILEKEVIPLWGERELSTIHKRDVIHLLETIALERESPVMADRVRAVLGSVFGFALEREIVSRSPVDGTKSLKPPVAPQERMLADDEIRDLWAALSTENPVIGAAFKMLLLTGQRTSEVLTMRWDRIQLDVWFVGASKRSVVLSPQALQVLRDVKDEGSGSSYVFSMRGGKPLSYIRKAARRLNSATNSAESWAPNDLRRTMRLGLYKLGFSPHVVESTLGNSPQIRPSVRKVALASLEDDKRNAMLQWGRRVAQIVGRPKPSDPGEKVVKIFG